MLSKLLKVALYQVLLLTLAMLTLITQAANMSLNKHRILLDENHQRDDLLVFNPTGDFQSYRITVEDFAMDE